MYVMAIKTILLLMLSSILHLLWCERNEHFLYVLVHNIYDRKEDIKTNQQKKKIIILKIRKKTGKEIQKKYWCKQSATL